MTATTTVPTLQHQSRGRPRLQEAGLLVVIVLLGAFLTIFAPVVHAENGFLRPDNLIPSVFTNMSWMAIMAVGLTCGIICGGIDISVGSVFGLAALGTAAVLQNFPEAAPAWQALPTAFAVALGIGLACGLLNGVLVVGLRMHPFIVTLGTLSIYRGIAVVSVKEGSLPYGDRGLPAAFTDGFIAYTIPMGPWGRAPAVLSPVAWAWNHWITRPTTIQPVPMLLMAAIVGLGAVFLHLTVWGRETYAVGGNEEAARFAGLNVGWVKLRVYLLVGLLAGFAGMISCGFYKSAATNTGLGYELMVVAAAVVGGASLSGGRGTALGALLGMLVIQMIDNGTQILSRIHVGPWTIQVSKEYTQIIIGIAIIAAVAVDRFSEYLQQRRLSRRGVTSQV